MRRGEEEEKLLLGGTQLRFIINFHQATDLTGTREGRKEVIIELNRILSRTRNSFEFPRNPEHPPFKSYHGERKFARGVKTN